MTGSLGSCSVIVLCERHFGGPCSVRLTSQLYVEIRQETVLPKQPLGTQLRLKCITSGATLEDEGIDTSECHSQICQ